MNAAVTITSEAGSKSTQLRYSEDGSIVMVWSDGKPLRCPTQDDMDSLPVGEDMTEEEVAELDV